MRPELLGIKVGMTRVVNEAGVIVPVTIVQAGPCTVLQVKTLETDGYYAVQLGYRDIKPHRSTKPMIGHAAKAGTGPKRFVREVRLDGPTELSPGDVVTVELFDGGAVKMVDVAGVSKGKGFMGVMRRHGFGGLPASHGTERKHRAPGSIGGHASGNTGRGIKKGRPMPGHMGHARRTTRSQKLVGVDAEAHLLLVEGGVPGPAGGLVVVRRAIVEGS